MSKKRKEYSQSTTLHSFFASDSITSPSKKPKSATSIARALALPKDVIVIDSDSDGEYSTRENSSQVEFNRVQIVGAEARNAIPPLVPSVKTFFGEAPALRSVSASSAKVQVPQSLSLPPNVDFTDYPDTTPRDKNPSLPEQSPSEEVALTAKQASWDFAQDEFQTDNIIQTQSDEDWAMGDDEMADISPEEDEDMHETSEESHHVADDDSHVSTCPICEQVLVGFQALEVQEHVNLCLDATPAPSSWPTMTSPPYSSRLLLNAIPKTLRPASQLPDPRLCQSDPDVSSVDLSGNAFSILMTSHKENRAWKEAAVVEDPKFRPSKNNGRRKAPFYKVLQGMPIAVDAFRYGSIPGVTSYFLTHAHSDHYTNLSSSWKSGPIYCSHATADLIIHMLSVNPKWVHPLPMEKPREIPNTGGVTATLIEANHCPGSCLFLFEGRQTISAGDSAYKLPFVGSTRTFRYLHCGDFRASPQHTLHPAVKGKRLDIIYLDTTYLDPKYTFPPQPLVISACAELARKIAMEESLSSNSEGAQTMDAFVDKSRGKQPEDSKRNERVLFIVGTYSIGKERIVKAIAHALQTKVYCDARKAAILRCEHDAELDALLTSDPLNAKVHVVPLALITSDRLKTYMDKYKGSFTRAVAFRPTGWTYTQPAGTNLSPTIPALISRAQSLTFTSSSLKPTRQSTARLTLYGVPYSEHSSFFELTCFALSVEWGKIVATVNVGSEASRGRMGRWIERWEAERRRRRGCGEEGAVGYRTVDYW